MECALNEDYLKITRATRSFASDESYTILDGSTVVLVSEALDDNSFVTTEHCIRASATHLYTLELKDIYDNSWSAGSFIQIDGIYGNPFFKNMMIHHHLERYTLSLLYPILKGQTWKTSREPVPADWNDLSFIDKSWMDYTAGNHSLVCTGTQYFRYYAIGAKNMAAYEAQFLYQHGIIVYVNGNEVFRDNMPSGPVSSDTLPTNSYATADFHGFVRPGVEIMDVPTAVAVELHFDSETSEFLFDCFLAVYGATALDAPCYIVTKDVFLSTNSSEVTDIIRLFDLDRDTYASVSYKKADVIDIQYDFSLRPYINGLLIYTGYSIALPTEFTWDGKAEGEDAWSNIFRITDAQYKAKSSNLFFGFFSSGLFQSYRLHITDSDVKVLRLNEIQPMVCAVGVPTSILYTTSSYSVLAKYNSVLIEPIVKEFTNCELAPLLPEGVTLNSTNCVVSGVPMEAMEETTFTIISRMNDQVFTGEFSLTVVGCDQILVDIQRLYCNFPNREGFEVTNLETNEVVYTMTPMSEQLNEELTHIYLCLPQSRFQVTMVSIFSSWNTLSLLNVYIVFDGGFEELVASGHYDSLLGYTTLNFTTEYPIFVRESWYYLMGSIPPNWINDDKEHFSLGMVDNFPDSPNSIQLYKKSFTLPDVTKRAGFVLNIRYQAGVIVYLNGVEAWRNNVIGELSTLSLATQYHPNSTYQQVSLPIRTIATDTKPSVSYLKNGLNTIAIALVASDYTQQSSVFDCALHILSVGSEPRIMTDFKMTYSEVFGALQCFFMGDLECYIRGYVSNNYLRITFDNGRREWVNSIDLVMSHKQLRYLIHSMVVKARNSDSEEWTTLASPTQISWPIIGQSRRFFFVNNQPYNQYSFENFAGDDPVWNVYHLKLNAHPTGMAIPDLAYPQHSMEIYQNIAIAEMYPLYDYYFDFDMNSTLPQDLGLDPYNGRISGIPRNLSSSHPYQIVAKKYTGELTSVTLSISVVLCYGGKSVITLAVMQDMYDAGYSYNLYGGKDTSGQLVSTIQSFMEVTQLYFVDYCLPHALYTLEIIDNNGGNAPNYNGYYLSVDFGALKFETGLIPYNAYSVTLHFSSYLPFQINLDDWQVEKFTDLTGTDWTAIDFDDSGWQRMKASAIGTSQLTTVYIRRSFEIPDLHDYTLLNVRIRYTGGIVAYFNGQKVARFNLEDDASSSQSSISIHDPNTFSIFHIIFSTTQAVVGKNVIAFEVHRPITYTSAKIITFDATGVFGVSDCSLALDSYVTMDSSLDDPLVVEQIFDFTPSRLYALESRAGAHIHWMVENMEGTRFNAYAWQVSSNNTGWGISLYARSSGPSGPSNYTEGYVKVFTGTDLSLKEMARTVYPTPLNLVPFDEFLFMVDVPLDRSTDVYSQSFLYCKASGTDSCSGIDEFPAVGNGSVSPAACPYGYAGYRYRECLNGQLSAIHDEFCELKAPKHLKYEASSFHFFIDASSSTGLPHYTNLIHQFSIYGGKQLPLGLALDPQSGEISGVPEVEWANETFVVLGENSKGSTFTRITIKVEQGYCEADSVFERTKAGECAVHVCGSQGKYIGMKRRKCEATTSGGKWSHTEGICVSIFSVVVLILLVVILGLLVVALLIRIRRTKKQGKKKRSRRMRIQRYCNDEFEMVHF